MKRRVRTAAGLTHYSSKKDSVNGSINSDHSTVQRSLCTMVGDDLFSTARVRSLQLKSEMRARGGNARAIEVVS